MKRNVTLVIGLVLSVLFVAYSTRTASVVTAPNTGETENASDSPDEARQYFLQKRVPPGETILPAERYLVADQQVKQLAIYSTATNTFYASATQGNLGTWEELGPGNIGGRTRALLIDPANGNIMYAGGVAGGIWKTIDGGQNWRPKRQIPFFFITLLRGSDDSQNSRVVNS
jgi:hypothetical protein